MRIFLLVMCFAFSWVPQAATAAEPLEIIRITPDSLDVPEGRQIVITFNRSVVSVGKMERDAADIPVSIVPAVNCQWRWINVSSLACNLDEKDELKKSTVYAVTVEPGIRAVDGATIADTYRHTFTTERADVRYAWFRTWKSPGYPIIRLTFNQPVTKKSVEDALYFTYANSVMTHKLSASADPDYRSDLLYIRLPGDKNFILVPESDQRRSDDQETKIKGDIARRIWLVEPAQEMPLDRSVTLRSRAGLVSSEGDAPGAMDRDIVAFHTFPEFAVLGIKCLTNAGESVLIKAGERATQSCDPMAPVSLSFTNPVFRSEVAKNFVFSPKLGDISVWGDLSSSYSRLSQPHEQGRTYDVNLPYGLKALQEYSVSMLTPERSFFAGVWYWIKSLFIDLPETEMQNEFYQKLMQPVTLSFKTDNRRPNFELNHHDAVLEKASDAEVPLYVNNLERFRFKYRKLDAAGVTTDLEKSTELPKDVRNIQFAVPFGVRDALGGKTGAVYGLLETDPYVHKGWEGAYRLFAQVTPWQVHVKLGHFSSAVWVTDMKTGEAVKGANVSIYTDRLSNLAGSEKTHDSSKTDLNGIAKLKGTEAIDPDLMLKRGWNDDDLILFVRVEKEGDVAFVPLNNDFMIDTWRASNEYINNRIQKKYGHMAAWGTTAQGIYRAGDTIQYKIYVRNQDNLTLTPARQDGYQLEIIDAMGKTAAIVENVSFNAFGAFDGEFTLGKKAPVGWYTFRLSASFGGTVQDENTGEERRMQWTAMNVLVSDFTPVPFKVVNSLNGDLFRDTQEVTVTSHAEMHAGGPYADAGARVTATVVARSIVSKDPKVKDFTFSSAGQGWSEQVFQKVDAVDGKGALETQFNIPETSIYYGRLEVETAVQDDRGKYIASLASADYVARDRFVGLRPTQWAYPSSREGIIEYAVLDDKGMAVAGTDVKIMIEREETVAAKVKGAGNAYVTNYTTTWVKESECKGVSVEDTADCLFTPQKTGSYRATAVVKDSKGREHKTEVGMWVTGKDYVVWNNESDSILPLVPEKSEYRVGERARYLVKNPYPGAKALVSIERYGVIDSFVTTLEGSTPVIEFPVKPDYLPGFYLSVVVVSPRAADKPVDAQQVDLGKPAFRIGYVTVPVRDKFKEMTVTAKTDAELYRPRDKVRVTLHAEPREKGKREPVELAIAVLDEAVFDLVAGGAKNFDPYDGFYKLDGLDLANYNLLTRLIGRQKFEKKGANPGGDGGADLKMRDLFKFVAYWNPSVKASVTGDASITFDAPDNLTGWRILAMAVTPTDRLGLGQGNFKVNRPTEVRPVMPNQITERDFFKAGFSVMNRTDKPRTLEVKIKTEGPVDIAKTPAEYSEKVTLNPFKRTTVFMPVQTLPLPETSGADDGGKITFTASASDAEDADGMTHVVPVNKMRSLVTAATYGETTEDKVSDSVAVPEGIYPDAGGISVVLSPSVIGNVEGAFRYIRNYPHMCWEQILTKGVMASHFKNLKAYMPMDFKWDGSEMLSQSALDMAASFQAPNGGMTYFIASDDRVDPYLSAYTALAFNWLKTAGYKVPASVEEKLHGYLDNLLRNNVMPTFYSEGMGSTIRAVALAALAPHGKVSADDIARYKTHVPQMSLFGKTHFMQAALQVDGGMETATEVSKLILSHANQTGGKFIFNEELDDSYSRVLASPLRENCAILSVFTDFGAKKEGAALVADVPFKLTRAIIQSRGSRDHWENTQENVFCMNAMVDYSRVYESETPDMDVTASFAGDQIGGAVFASLRDPSITLMRPMQAGDVGKTAPVDIVKNGKGRLYYSTRLQYAPRAENSELINAGMEIRREASVERDGKWTLLQNSDKIARGELVRVDLYLTVPAARNFVAVTDPVPGGLEPVNRDLANTSTVDAAKGDFQAAGGSWFFKFSDWVGYNTSFWSFYHKELRHDFVRFYADYLPAGNYHLSYTAQAIAEGNFVAMPVHAEEMYDPDVFGKGLSGELRVGSN